MMPDQPDRGDIGRWLRRLRANHELDDAEKELAHSIANSRFGTQGGAASLSDVLHRAVAHAGRIWQLTWHEEPGNIVRGELTSFEQHRATLLIRPHGEGRCAIEVSGIPEDMQISSLGAVTAPSHPALVTGRLSPPALWTTPVVSRGKSGEVHSTPQLHQLGAGAESDSAPLSVRRFASGGGTVIARYIESEPLGRIIDLEVICSTDWNGLYAVELVDHQDAQSVDRIVLSRVDPGAETLSELAREVIRDDGITELSHGIAALLLDNDTAIRLDASVALRPLSKEELVECLWAMVAGKEDTGVEKETIGVRSSEDGPFLDAAEVMRILRPRTQFETIYFVECEPMGQE